MKKINRYNQKVQNWNFEVEELTEFFRLLTERNLFVLGKTRMVDFHAECNLPPKNKAFVDHTGIGLLEQIAFHVGFPHQRRLYSLIDEQTGSPNNEGVFFSLKPQDVVYFAEFDKKPLSMVYLLNVARARDLLVQAKYDSPVISRYDVDDVLLNSQGSERKNLMGMHQRLDERWIKQNTVPFEVEKLEEYRAEKLDWLVTPDPIEVKY